MRRSLFFAFIVLFLLFSGCYNANIGGGQSNEIESAFLSVVVGAKMSASPETIIPAYTISAALLSLINGSEKVHIENMDAVISTEIDKLELTKNERQSMIELVELVKAELLSRFNGIDREKKIIMVRNFIEIVHSCAANRLPTSNLGKFWARNMECRT